MEEYPKVYWTGPAWITLSTGKALLTRESARCASKCGTF